MNDPDWQPEEELWLPKERQPTYYHNHIDWFVDWMADMYSRKVGGRAKERAWCADWVLHYEANARLNSLWCAWESCRLDGDVGMSVWWRDHADYHMSKLFAHDGTFRFCTPGPDGHMSKSRKRVFPFFGRRGSRLDCLPALPVGHEARALLGWERPSRPGPVSDVSNKEPSNA